MEEKELLEIEADFGFGILPREIMRSQLSITAKTIYSYFISFAGNTKKAFPSVKLICKELDISKDTFYKYLKELKNYGVVEIEKQREQGKFTKNIYKLSPCPKPSYTVTSYTTNQDTNNNSILNNNNNNKEKIYKETSKIIKYFDSNDVNELFIEFLDLRKKLKAVNSDRAINGLLNILNKYDDETKKQMIEKSIINSWKSVYELKEQKTNVNSKIEDGGIQL